jgi:hypothetical protein
MIKIKTFDIFESVDIKQQAFTLTHEDIEDLLLVFIDKGYQIEFEDDFLVDQSYNRIDRYYGYHTKEIDLYRNILKSGGDIYGAYKISIYKKLTEDEDVDDDKKVYSFKQNDIDDFKFILNELSQLSKRVKYIEWEIDSDGVINLYIVCPKDKIKDTVKKEFLKSEYHEMLNTLMNDRLRNNIERIKNRLTPNFSKAAILLSRSIDDIRRENGIHLFFKNAPKVSASVSSRKIQNVALNHLGNSEVELVGVEEFKKSNPNVQVPKDTAYVITLKFDIDHFIKRCKSDIKSKF